MLVRQLKEGTAVYKTNADGLAEIAEWVPPTRLMLQAARRIEKDQGIINGFIHALSTAEVTFAGMQETILRQNLIIQDLRSQLESNDRGNAAQAPGNE